jgi:hypothetical protein
VSTTDTAVDATARARDLLGVSRLTNQALTNWLHGLPGVDQVGCEARATGLGTRSITNDSTRWAIDRAISMIDLTTLEGADTVGRVRGLVSVIAPAIAGGNTVVVVSSKDRPLPASTLSECLATSDVPGGVVNIITGDAVEIAPWLASHRDVNGLDLTGCAGLEGADWGTLETVAADTLKRVIRPAGTGANAVEPDWSEEPSLARMSTFLETKTVWHPKGP